MYYFNIGREKAHTMLYEDWNILKRAEEKYFVLTLVTEFVGEIKGKRKFLFSCRLVKFIGYLEVKIWIFLDFFSHTFSVFLLYVGHGVKI